MKSLEYLNLALNNIEIIENLEGCESLQKLDFTLNFIGDLFSVEKLQANRHLEHLYLSGNPCTDFEGYREYVIATLPQLRSLDGVQIERSLRIKALQNYDLVKPMIISAQLDYKKRREHQRETAEKKRILTENTHSSAEEDEKFWNESSDNTPETRIELAKHSRRSQQQTSDDKKNTKHWEVKLFNKDGRPNNINQAKIPFNFEEDDKRNCFVLTLGIFRYLDTALLDVDVQPLFVTVRIKGKVFQLTMSEEVAVAQSTALRSQTTGHLVITMPKVKGVVKPTTLSKPLSLTKEQKLPSGSVMSKRQYLEIGMDENGMDFSRIIEKNKAKNKSLEYRRKVPEKLLPEGFQDNLDVPPLE